MKMLENLTPLEIESDSAAQTCAPAALWQLGNGQSIGELASFGVMGIVNITTDSFYDGGQCLETAKAVRRASQLCDEGASVIDLGAESSRPGAQPVSSRTECQRLAEVITAFRKERSDGVISVDTWRAVSAQAALEAGAQIINDISGARLDPAMLEILAQYRPGYVLMHCQGTPATMQRHPVYSDVCSEVEFFFETSLDRLACAGLPESHVVLDPGIGFGKTLEHNLALLKNIGRFLSFGRPLLVGISMKSFFGQLLGLPLNRRREATQAAVALLWERGVAWHRVHHVSDAVTALKLAASFA